MRTQRIALAVAAVALLAAAGAAIALAAGSGGGSWTAGLGRMGVRYVYRPAQPTQVRTLAAARADAQQFADRLGLRVGEVLQFQRSFYVTLVDSAGKGATEVLVDPSSGTVSVEYGPAMVWNTRYGMGQLAGEMMGSYGPGMMGRYGATGTTPGGSSQTAGTVSLARAHTLAQTWLAKNEPGVKVESGGDTFPGYYTLETLKGGKITGMISVNASTGAVWPHWWHGAFIARSG